MAVGRLICQRVAAEAQAQRDLLSGLARIGFDEIAIRKGQRYLTIVVDHDTGKLVWAHPGRDRKTTEKFLDLLGEERCQEITLISCDDADWITRPVTERCPNATVCLDPFHIVKAATDALDKVRREVWNEARRQGQTQLARELKGARFALWKNPENLTERQQLKLARIQKLNHRLYRAYLLCQQLRQIYRVPADHALLLLDAWLNWARRCRLEPFVKVALSHHRAASNGRGGHHEQALQRRRRASQHPDPADHPTRVRLPLALGSHRSRDAVTRGPLPTPTRPVTQPTETSGDSFL
jgi:transposase